MYCFFFFFFFLFFLFFFFQAEDGIRDDLVTGVQTCALPISIYRPLMADKLQPLFKTANFYQASALSQSQLTNQINMITFSLSWGTSLHETNKAIPSGGFCVLLELLSKVINLFCNSFENHLKTKLGQEKHWSSLSNGSY